MKPLIRSSSLDRFLQCSGSQTLCAIVAPREDSEDSLEGTAIHHAIATRLINELGATPPEGGLPLAPAYVIPKPSRWIVDWAVRYVRETVPEDWSIAVEVEMECEFPRWRNKGHADVVAFSPCGRKSKGIDWKCGRDPVDPADNNEQVASYIMLAKSEWPALEEMEFSIAQPRLDDEEFPRVSTVTVTNMDALTAAMDARACSALERPMELSTGKHCGYCNAILQCPATKALREHMKWKMNEHELAAMTAKPNDATIADWVIDGRVVGKATDEAEKLAKARIAEAGEIVSTEGTVITVKTTGGSYTVTDKDAFYAGLKELIPEKAMAACAKWSVTAIRDAIAEHMAVPETSKVGLSARSIFDAKLGAFVEQGKREALTFRT